MNNKKKYSLDWVRVIKKIRSLLITGNFLIGQEIWHAAIY